MSCKVITIANSKGGCSKTTTASLLAVGLRRKGFHVLAIDTDSQGNLSTALHARQDDEVFCLADLMEKITVADDEDGRERPIEPEDAIQHTEYCDVIAGNVRTASAVENLDLDEKLTFLDDFLEPLREQYDFIIIDTSPAKDLLIKNALIASDGAVIPTTASEWSIAGIGGIAETMAQARKKRFNPGLKLYGILLTKVNKQTVAAKDAALIVRESAEAMGSRMFTTYIRQDENVNKSQMALIPESERKFEDETGVILYDYAPNCRAAQDYLSFIDELLAVIEEE